MDATIERAVCQLRAARLRSGIPQAELAERLGTTQSAVARLEAGQSDPRIGTVQRYAEAVGMRLTLVPSGALATTAQAVSVELGHRDTDSALRHIIQFLDDFARMEPWLRRAAVVEEPATVGDRRWDALLAGIAEYACHRFGIVVPGWTAAPSRFLSRFWFVIEEVLGRPSPGLAAQAFVKTPAALANRGVFLDADSLVSV